MRKCKFCIFAKTYTMAQKLKIKLQWHVERTFRISSSIYLNFVKLLPIRLKFLINPTPNNVLSVSNWVDNMTKWTKCNSSPKVIALGNALVDLTFQIQSDEILKKYNLQPDYQGEVTVDVLKNLINDAQKESKILKQQPGGSALNTCKILKILGECDAFFCGAIGNDNIGQMLVEALQELSIKSFIQTIEGQQTGAAICLISGPNRCCVANIGASKHFHAKELKKFLMQHSIPKIIYIEGYFIPDRVHDCHHIVKTFCQQTNENDCKFAFNLSAPYIVIENKDFVKVLCESASMLFGNLIEFEALTQIYGLKTVDSLVRRLLNTNHSFKVIVITNNEKSVQYYVQDSSNIEKVEHQVKSISEENIVDTTGAGDSFVAGFFFKYLRGCSISSCVQFGCETAARKITMIGANLPEL